MRPVPYEGRLSWHSLFLSELISSLEVGVNMVYSQLHMQPLVLRSLMGFWLYWWVGEGWRKNTQVCRKSKAEFCRGDGVWDETWRKDKGIYLRLPRTQGYRWSLSGRTWVPKSDASSNYGSWEGCALKGYCEDEKYQVQNACHHSLQMTTIAALFKPDHCRRLWNFALRLPEHHCYNPWHCLPFIPHSTAKMCISLTAINNNFIINYCNGQNLGSTVSLGYSFKNQGALLFLRELNCKICEVTKNKQNGSQAGTIGM